MITDTGKSLLLQYLSGRVRRWADTIEIGIGNTAATVNDKSLEFPYQRFDVDNVDFDDVNNKVIVRATIPQDVATSIYEVGLFTSENFSSVTVGNIILSTFIAAEGPYVTSGGGFTNSNMRLGNEGYEFSLASSGSGSIRRYVGGVDLSQYAGQDVVNLAYYYNHTSAVPTIEIRFESTPTDYYAYSFSPTAADGYYIETTARENFTTTGSPSWATIDAVNVEVTAGAGVATVALDGLGIEESVTVADYGMVARNVLGTPQVKVGGVEAELTFELGLTF